VVGGLFVLLNHGDATFAPATLYAVSTPKAVAIGDLDGDGRPDLAVAHGSAVAVLRNAGGGSFASPFDVAVDAAGDDALEDAFSVAVADLDGDGRLDIAVTSQLQPNVHVLRNLGGGQFAAPIDFPAGNQARSLAVDDVDGDGRPDIVVAGLNGVSVLINDGR
jgi:hypothetical protein